MATSFQFPSDHHHQIVKPQAETMNLQTAATGRRRSSKNSQKKKKQPQRGMGVEQLERLLMQDQIKNTIVHGHHHQYYSNNNFPNFTTLSSFTAAGGGASASVSSAAVAVADPGIYSNSILNSSPVFQFPKLSVSPNDSFVQQKLIGSGSTGPTGPAVAFGDQLMISSHDHHQFQPQMGLYGFATSKPAGQVEKPKELSSIPNLFSSNSSCFSDRCRSCNKKKRMINGEEMNIQMEDMIREKEDSGTKPFLHPYAIPSRLEKGVEIVAIHRKGSSSEEGAVVMEYEFFPEKSGSSRSTNNTSCFGRMMMMSTNNSSESSSVAAATAAVGNIINGETSSVTTISWADTTTPTSSIDLSLKLSC